ncbi:MAG: M24 family metallopeptidase [Candidatus Melainabacteria bacterium]|nr:M24 family metallopeptidase [Candidatus Melainabacteria bacterium]
MDWRTRIQDVQKHLQKDKIDGWLLYDFVGNNPLARDFLKLDPELLVTRRFFYWIPAKGEPIKIHHMIEQHVLDALPGNKVTYLKWEELEAQLKKVLNGSKTVAMEYSPRCAIPYLSKVDAGMVDLIRSFNVEVVSSASFLQYYTCVLDDEQLESHLEAANFLDKTVAAAWEKISSSLKSGTKINEYQVRQFIAAQLEANGFMFEGQPICAVNAHSADPHYEPPKEGSSEIKKGDFVLIDLWGKKKQQRAIYGDICRVGVADVAATPKQKEIFSIVRAAQKAATDFVIDRYGKGMPLKGYEVDQVSRKIIEEKGYGQFFTHRTGHNIYTKDHGPGAHIDSLETLDLRQLIPHICFSIEPGIYLPGEFGVRLEYDVYLGDAGNVRITGGVQEKIEILL